MYEYSCSSQLRSDSWDTTNRLFDRVMDFAGSNLSRGRGLNYSIGGPGFNLHFSITNYLYTEHYLRPSFRQVQGKIPASQYWQYQEFSRAIFVFCSAVVAQNTKLTQ